MSLHPLHHPVVATLAVTAASVAMAAVVTQATAWWAGYDGGYLPTLLAGVVPALMVPFTVYPIANANRRLRQARAQGEQTPFPP